MNKYGREATVRAASACPATVQVHFNKRMSKPRFPLHPSWTVAYQRPKFKTSFRQPGYRRCNLRPSALRPSLATSLPLSRIGGDRRVRPNHSHRERGEFVRRELDNTEDSARRIVNPTLRRRCKVPIALTPFISKPMSSRGGVKLKDGEKPEVSWTFPIGVIWLSWQCDTMLKKRLALRQSLSLNEAYAGESLSCGPKARRWASEDLAHLPETLVIMRQGRLAGLNCRRPFRHLLQRGPTGIGTNCSRAFRRLC